MMQTLGFVKGVGLSYLLLRLIKWAIDRGLQVCWFRYPVDRLVPQGEIQNSTFKILSGIQRKRFVDLEWVVYLRRAVLGSRDINVSQLTIAVWWRLSERWSLCEPPEASHLHHILLPLYPIKISRLSHHHGFGTVNEISKVPPP